MDQSVLKSDDQKYIANTYNRFDVCIKSGKGATCEDFNGKRYLDFGSGIGVTALGYCDTGWADVAAEQAKTLQHTSNLYYTAPCVSLAKKLCETTGYQKVFFANSGAEANECAIKTARKYSFDKYGEGRSNIITLENSFHGRTITTLAATGQDNFHQFFSPFTEGFRYVPANNIEALEKQLDGTICAVMIEFIQGEGGVCPLDRTTVNDLFTLCQKNDILIIADEVQTGMARTGKLLAGEHFGVKADIVTLAKGLGGGLPIGAVLLNEKCESTLSFGQHGSTFGANPVVCAGANYVLDRMTADGFLEEVTEKGNYLKAELEKMPEVEKVDGMGLMLGISLKTKAAATVAKVAAEKGILVLTAKQKLRMLPPLIISYEEIDKGLQILKTILEEKNR